MQGCGGSNDKEKCKELQEEIKKLRDEQKEKQEKEAKNKNWFADTEQTEEQKQQSEEIKELEEKIQKKEDKQSGLKVKRGQNQFDESDPLSDIKLTPEEQIKVDKLILENLKYLNQPEHKDERDVSDAWLSEH